MEEEDGGHKDNHNFGHDMAPEGKMNRHTAGRHSINGISKNVNPRHLSNRRHMKIVEVGAQIADQNYFSRQVGEKVIIPRFKFIPGQPESGC